MKKKDQCNIADQRLMWDDLRKSINDMVSRVSESNISDVAEELISKNLIWGRGLFCRSILRTLIADSTRAPVFAALVAGVNSKFPDVGYLLLKRILFQARIACELNDEIILLPFAKLLAHLVNQCVVHEVVTLELLFDLLKDPIPAKEKIKVAVGFVTECGAALFDRIPRKLDSIFERFRGILAEGDTNNSFNKCLIEGLFAIRKFRSLSYLALHPELDIVEPDDQVTHEISNYNDLDPEMHLDVFQPYSNLIINYQ